MFKKIIISILLVLLVIIVFRKRKERMDDGDSEGTNEFPADSDSRVSEQRGQSNLYDPKVVYPAYKDLVIFGDRTVPLYKQSGYQFPFPAPTTQKSNRTSGCGRR